jgi:hypothetical protein
MYYADPTALPGYLFGTSGRVIRGDREGQLLIIDETLGSPTALQVLNDRQLEAIHMIKIGRATPHVKLREQREALTTSYDAVKELGVYAMRGLVLLDIADSDSTFSRFNANLVHEAVSASYLPYVRRQKSKDIIKYLIETESIQRRKLAPRASEILSRTTGIYEANYWTAVRSTFMDGTPHVLKQPAAKLSWHHFASQFPQPIRTYEETMLADHLGFCKSTLYAPDTHLKR